MFNTFLTICKIRIICFCSKNKCVKKELNLQKFYAGMRIILSLLIFSITMLLTGSLLVCANFASSLHTHSFYYLQDTIDSPVNREIPVSDTTETFVPDTVIDREVPVASDTIIEADEIIIKPDTVAVDTIATDTLDLPDEAEVVREPEKPRPPVSPAVKKPAYTVLFDSILTNPSAKPKTYSGNEFFNEHFLTTEKISPEKNKPDKQNWPIIVLIVIAGLVGLARYLQPSGIKQSFKGALNNHNFQLLIKEQNPFSEWFSHIMIFCFVACFSLLAYQSILILDLIKIENTAQSLQIYFTIMALVMAFYILKYAGLRFVGFVFKANVASASYFKNILLFNQIIAIALFPLLMYNAIYIAYSVIVVAWGLFAFLSIIKVLRSVAIGHSVSNFSLYYLFLYLCAVEIMPLLIIIKASVNYFREIQ